MWYVTRLPQPEEAGTYRHSDGAYDHNPTRQANMSLAVVGLPP
jgi:hypothetical protein